MTLPRAYRPTTRRAPIKDVTVVSRAVPLDGVVLRRQQFLWRDGPLRHRGRDEKHQQNQQYAQAVHGVAVTVGVGVNDAAQARLPAKHGVGKGHVATGVGVLVFVGDGVGVAVFVDVAVTVGVGVRVGVGVLVGVAVFVGVTVGVSVGVGVAVFVGVAVGVGVAHVASGSHTPGEVQRSSQSASVVQSLARQMFPISVFLH